MEGSLLGAARQIADLGLGAVDGSDHEAEYGPLDEVGNGLSDRQFRPIFKFA
jgi:hypothetical protein